MPKVLHIPAEIYPTHESVLGEVFSKEDTRYQSIFLMRTEQELPPRTTWNKSKVYLIPRYSHFKIINKISSYFCMDLRYVWLLPWLVFKERVDIIQVRDLTFPLFIALLLKILLRRRVIYQKSHPHEYKKIQDARQSKSKLPKLLLFSRLVENRFLHWMLRHCDAVLPITSFMADNLNRDHGIPYEKMIPFGMGFSFEDAPVPRKVGIAPAEPLRFIYVGTLARERQLDILLQGVSHAVKKWPEKKITLELVGGTGKEVTALRSQANNLGIGHLCIFRGRIERKKVYQRISESHIGISWVGSRVRYSDASPTKMIEYLSLGLPVIATDSVYEHARLIQETKAGVICNVDPDDFADKLAMLAGNYNKYKKRACNAQEYMQVNFSYTEMRGKVLELYKQICRVTN